ncbi:bifunctional phosphopantothenoylcysteine decarboxylase/phosphopantothenate--cysteine ligase CoaBC [Chryseolinea sp. T2]|uniref:bifunctional phosphopantothenoylcysteine decarboxylase/phosphopantothenate--cysteine ligase CoaBC n=1 Tax=Chryseolinea sp. T2 TaxID=3129255 RepID=UPI00307886C2
MLKGKRILLGVCGGIAAYKTAVLTRLLVKEGAVVKVIMTPSAHEFITPLTLSTLSKNPVLTAFSKGDTGEWNSHVDLGLWADVMVIAPATANTIAKMAHAQADNLLLATYLSARCPVFVAPAMDLDMFQHLSVRENLEKLLSYGNHIIDPGIGELASGLSGQGRMAEPEDILQKVQMFFTSVQPLRGVKALVTAGPTLEAIDPVRFISNHSSGKMGFAIAEALANFGAEVHLVCGPTQQHTNHPLISVTPVISAEQMYEACRKSFETVHIAVLAAAVADYLPVTAASEKIKKKDSNINLELTKTRDIAAELGKGKRVDQVLVGFALETNDEVSNALKKLKAKNFDLIVLNSLQDKGAGFGLDTNKVTIIDRNEKATTFELKGKREVANDIVNAIVEILQTKRSVTSL